MGNCSLMRSKSVESVIRVLLEQCETDIDDITVEVTKRANFSEGLKRESKIIIWHWRKPAPEHPLDLTSCRGDTELKNGVRQRENGIVLIHNKNKDLPPEVLHIESATSLAARRFAISVSFPASVRKAQSAVGVTLSAKSNLPEDRSTPSTVPSLVVK